MRDMITSRLKTSDSSSTLSNPVGMIIIFLLGAVAVAAANVAAQNVFDEILIQSTEIDPDPPGFSSNDSRYGSAVALHDGRLIMSGTGSPIFVFHNIDGSWEELQILFLPPGGSSQANSGQLTLATFGDFLLVGDSAATLYDVSPRTGLVHIAEWDGLKYQFRGSLSPEDPNAQSAFGANISVNSSTLFVGAPGAGDGKGRVFAYEIPENVANLAHELPFVSLAAPSDAGERYGESLDASDAWLVVKQQTPTDAVAVSAIAYPLSQHAVESPVIIELEPNSFDTAGSDIHVRENIALLRRKKDTGSFVQRSDYLQFRLLGDSAEELPKLSDDDFDRGFLPVLAETQNLLHLVSVFDDPNFGNPVPEIFTASWNGSSWTLDPNKADAPADLFDFEDLPTISSATANASSLLMGNPGFRPSGSAGGGLSVVALGNPAVLAQILDAGRDGSGRMLGHSLARTDSSLIVGAPGWCKVYVLDATSPDFSLEQTLTTNPPCSFGADVVSDGEMLYVGNPAWQPSSGMFRPEEGQVHVFSLEGGSYIEQAPIRVLPHIGMRRLGERLFVNSEHLFIAGSGEVFLFETSQIPDGPAASAPFDTVLGRNGLDLTAGHGTAVVSVSGRLGGILSIFGPTLKLEQTIADPASDFGNAIAVLGPDKIVTTRMQSIASYEFSNGTWSLSDSVTPDPLIPRFGSSMKIDNEQILIGTSDGFVTSKLDNGELNLDIPVAALEPDFFAPVIEIAQGLKAFSVFIGLPGRVVSQNKRDLLLFIEFDAVIKHDGFESLSP